MNEVGNFMFGVSTLTKVSGYHRVDLHGHVYVAIEQQKDVAFCIPLLCFLEGSYTVHVYLMYRRPFLTFPKSFCQVPHVARLVWIIEVNALLLDSLNKDKLPSYGTQTKRLAGVSWRCTKARAI